jgi:hypothetical protein
MLVGGDVAVGIGLAGAIAAGVVAVAGESAERVGNFGQSGSDLIFGYLRHRKI